MSLRVGFDVSKYKVPFIITLHGTIWDRYIEKMITPPKSLFNHKLRYVKRSYDEFRKYIYNADIIITVAKWFSRT